jgi:Acyl-CoA synthetase (NDP forming)
MADQVLVQALLKPGAVALYGASGDPMKNTGRPQRFLKAHGYPGRIVPINPNRDTVQGETAYAKAVDAPAGIEQVLIMVPKQDVLAAVEDCAVAGIKVATIYSDGFAETGAEGMALQNKIVAAAHAGGMRIVGPNSMGTIDLNTPMTLSINAILEMENIPAGNLSV